MAAAAAIQSMIPRHLPGSKKSSKPAEDVPRAPHNNEEQEREKHFVAQMTTLAEPLPPKEIAENPKHKQLGGSSHQLRIDDFELVKTLGTGTFARVWLARLAKPADEDKDKVFALKILRKTDVIKLKQVEHVRNERNTLGAVAGHPFITTLITTFSDQECLYMLLDYCPGGEVFTYLRRARRFNETTARFYAAEIALILEFLHDVEGTAYRDLKPENILIDSEGHLKLVDFGFAKKIGDTETYTLCGTPEYLAPEVIKNTGHGTAVDWWAFGILIYEFLVGQPPFWDQNPLKIYSKIVDGKIPYPQGMLPEARDLIAGLCTVNPANRLGNISGGSQRVKDHPFFRGIDWDALYYRRMKGPIIPKLAHAADASNFDDYDPEPKRQSVYTREMSKQYEEFFKEF
ncbi:serine/threonine protein kinase, AGC [Xylographa opegraphella]|nr:serine/threonine protein kinase, AGC [Xylographa opegraphella]